MPTYYLNFQTDDAVQLYRVEPPQAKVTQRVSSYL